MGPYFFEGDDGVCVTVNAEHYKHNHVFVHSLCALYSIRNNEIYLESSTNIIYCLKCKKCVSLHNNNNNTYFDFS